MVEKKKYSQKVMKKGFNKKLAMGKEYDGNFENSSKMLYL